MFSLRQRSKTDHSSQLPTLIHGTPRTEAEPEISPLNYLEYIPSDEVKSPFDPDQGVRLNSEDADDSEDGDMKSDTADEIHGIKVLKPREAPTSPLHLKALLDRLIHPEEHIRFGKELEYDIWSLSATNIYSSLAIGISQRKAIH